MKKKIFTLIIVLLIIISSITTYAWYIEKSNVGYIVSSNIDLGINGYYSYTDSNNNPEQEWESLSETKTNIQIKFDYNLNFAFVVTNNSDKDIDLSLRFSDFSSYIFTSFDGTESVSDTTKNNINNYNTKFFLYIDSFKTKDVDASTYTPSSYNPDDKDLTDIVLNQDSNYECSDNTNFLWRYSYNNIVNRNKIKIEKNKSKVIYLILKNSQSQVSLKQDYTKWLYSYGKSYIKNNTSYTDEDEMQKYLEAYYELEHQSLYEDQDGASVLKDTKLCIDYFEFIADL